MVAACINFARKSGEQLRASRAIDNIIDWSALYKAVAHRRHTAAVIPFGINEIAAWLRQVGIRRMLEPTGNIPPAEVEESYYARLTPSAVAALFEKNASGVAGAVQSAGTNP